MPIASGPKRTTTRIFMGLLAFGAIASFFVFSRQGYFGAGSLFLLILLACPLLHMFMHRGHSGHGGGHGGHQAKKQSGPANSSGS